jgi:hypothetical protein
VVAERRHTECVNNELDRLALKYGDALARVARAREAERAARDLRQAAEEHAERTFIELAAAAGNSAAPNPGDNPHHNPAPTSAPTSAPTRARR